jgi:hypothetical protein
MTSIGQLEHRKVLARLQQVGPVGSPRRDQEVTKMSEQAPKALPKTRVQLDLSPYEVERMNWMMTVCGIENRKDLFNNALTLLEWATGEVIEGKKIASFDDSTKERTILSMPILHTAVTIGKRFARPLLRESFNAT